jgi:Flp pilus assembly protein TadG
MSASTSARSMRGQSLVEFALVLPLFLLLIFGTVDGGRAVFSYNDMAQATRNVARVASTACFQTGTACDASTGPIAATIASQSGMLVKPTWTVACINPATDAVPTNTGPDFCKVGYLVRVAISAPFAFVTPVASSFAPITVGATSEQEILQ